MFSLSEVAHTFDRACRNGWNVKGALYFRGFFVYSPRSVPDTSLVILFELIRVADWAFLSVASGQKPNNWPRSTGYTTMSYRGSCRRSGEEVLRIIRIPIMRFMIGSAHDMNSKITRPTIPPLSKAICRLFYSKVTSYENIWKCKCGVERKCDVIKNGHRLNLAVEAYIDRYLESEIDLVSNLMSKLSTLKEVDRLRMTSSLRPVKRNKTRLLGVIKMLDRYERLRPHIDDINPDVA
ncbi:hypothetical protein AXG93_684s1250 [Marchantia polymorpha subsp. ruderalis]|uniref:Uncharacterized protein n=1 Tax=Marchantia polymorpha subsp. ruderalis TaxID=1480154 RepID=A0A176W9R2_MARPO|nr:hypothetical protein AXG93_684s1250 [Marchantia polymorpha subsp. ruderalis]